VGQKLNVLDGNSAVGFGLGTRCWMVKVLYSAGLERNLLYGNCAVGYGSGNYCVE
jgi:hypothetical protein